MEKRLRIVLAKAPLDGHDRGIEIIKDALINEGHEVFYFGLYKDLNDIVKIAIQEGADFIGLSAHTGVYLKCVEEIFTRLKECRALDIGLVVGGIIRTSEEKFLQERYSVKKVFVSGMLEASLAEIKTFFRESKGRIIEDFENFSSPNANDIGLVLSKISEGSIRIEDIRGRFKKPEKYVLTIGVTGHGGAGKSSLIDKMIAEFRILNKKVGVISVDPSDYKTGGALLGWDRIQMWRHIHDPGVYVYSMAARGHYGGIAKVTPEAVEILKIAGFDVVLVETIGIGQDQVAIKDVVDKVILVLTPDIGENQINKSGIMQIADYYVINKIDIKNPAPAEMALDEMLNRKQFINRPLIFKTKADETTYNGVIAIVKKLMES